MLRTYKFIEIVVMSDEEFKQKFEKKAYTGEDMGHAYFRLFPR